MHLMLTHCPYIINSLSPQNNHLPISGNSMSSSLECGVHWLKYSWASKLLLMAGGRSWEFLIQSVIVDSGSIQKQKTPSVPTRWCVVEHYILCFWVLPRSALVSKQWKRELFGTYCFVLCCMQAHSLTQCVKCIFFTFSKLPFPRAYSALNVNDENISYGHHSRMIRCCRGVTCNLVLVGRYARIAILLY